MVIHRIDSLLGLGAGGRDSWRCLHPAAHGSAGGTDRRQVGRGGGGQGSLNREEANTNILVCKALGRYISQKGVHKDDRKENTSTAQFVINNFLRLYDCI